MATTKGRIEKVQVGLTPKQIAKLLIKELVDTYPSMEGWTMSRVHTKQESLNERAGRMVEEAVSAAMKGQPKDHVEQAIRQGQREVFFLLKLVKRVQETAASDQQANALKALIVMLQVRSLLDQDSLSNDLRKVGNYLMEQTAYPVAPVEGAVIEAAFRNAVYPWNEVQQVICMDWVADHFERLGKQRVGKPYRQEPDDPEDGRPDAWQLYREANEEVAEHFATDAAYEAWLAGTDYNFNVADVTDAEFAAACEPVEQAVRQLVDTKAVVEGRRVYLRDVPISFLSRVGLVDREWLDGYVAELNEYGGLLLQRDFAFQSWTGDQHALAPYRVVGPGSDPSDDSVPDAKAEDLADIRREAAEHLKSFPGRTRVIDDRLYLHVDDYREWSDRLSKVDVVFEDGLSIRSWNAWRDANGGKLAELAGVRVGRLDADIRRSCFVICEDEREAEEQRLLRREAMDTVDGWRTTKLEIEGQEFVRRRLRNSLYSSLVIGGPEARTQVDEWRDSVQSLMASLYADQAAVDLIRNRYFDGQQLLFADALETIQRNVDAIERSIEMFNDLVDYRLKVFRGRQLLVGEKPAGGKKDRDGGFRIDPAEIKAGMQPLVLKRVQQIVDLARIELAGDLQEWNEVERLASKLVKAAKKEEPS